MAQHDAVETHDTDHEDHGHGRDPGEDGRFLALILTLVAVGLALGIGRHVPGATGHEESAAPRFEGIVTLADGRGELRGRIQLDHDLVRVKTAQGEVLLARSQVYHINPVDTSARPNGRGIVVLNSGQVFVGAFQQHADGVEIDGLSFPRERVRWSEAGVETLSDGYWSKFPKATLDPRWNPNARTSDAAGAAPTPPSQPRVVRDSFPTQSPPTSTVLSEPALPRDPNETKAQWIKRMVDRARYRQLNLDWPAAAQTWRDAYLESGQENHRLDLERCLDRWATDTLGPGGWEARFAQIEEVSRPVRHEVRQTLARTYLTLFEIVRDPNNLPLVQRMLVSLQELGEFSEPDLRDGVEGVEAFVLTFSKPEQDEDHGPFDGHDH